MFNRKRKTRQKRKLYRTEESLGETTIHIFFSLKILLHLESKRSFNIAMTRYKECKNRVSFHKHVLGKERKKQKKQGQQEQLF